MKYLTGYIFIALIFAGCSASIDTANLTPQERFEYAMELYNDEDYQEAANEFESLIIQYPGNAIVDDAQYYLGMTRFKREEFIIGAYEFSKLIKNMPASEFVSEAQFMLAECYYNLSPHYSLDQSYTRSGIKEYQAFIDFFPTDEKVMEAERKIKELNEKLAHKKYSSAVIYEKMEYLRAAKIYYNDVIEIYHDTKFAPMAMFNKIQILVDEDENREALAEVNKFLNRYPESPDYNKVEQIKESLENKISAVN